MKTKTWIAISVVATLLCVIGIEGGPAKAQGVAGDWELYAVYPYGPMNRQNPGLCRQDDPFVALAQGELESVCLVVDNRASTQTLDFRVSISPLYFPKDRIRVGRLVYLPARAGGPRQEIHPAKAGPEIADAIVPLGVAEPLTVGPKEVRHIWLTLDARGASSTSGVIEVTVRPLTPTANGRRRPSKKLNINFQIWPFALPEKTPITVFTWDYGSATQNDEWLRNFLEHRVNAFSVALQPRFSRVKNVVSLKLRPDGSLESQPDFSGLTDMLLRAKPYGKFFFETWYFRSRDSDKESGGWECTDGSTIPHLSDRWAIGYKQWLRALKAYLESLGIGTDQWYFLTHDEAFHQDGEKGSLGCAKLAYEVDPTIQFFMDTWPTRGPEQLEPWRKKGTNVTWCPDFGIYNLGPWHLLKSLNRPMWMYLCHEQTRDLSPHAFYRVRGWLAWIYGLDGIALWSPITRFGSGWDDLDGGHGDTCMILTDSDDIIPDMPEEARSYYYLWENNDRPPPADWDGKPINTRRWEAYREGIEDYLYLHLLDSLLKTKKPDASLAAKARKLMAKACEEFELATDHRYLGERKRRWIVTEDNAKTTQAQRKQIAELIIKLNR